MMSKRSVRFWWSVSVVCTTLFPVSFLIMPIVTENAAKGNRIILIASGILFWLSLVIGYGIWVKLNMFVRKSNMNKRTRINRKKMSVLSVCTYTVFIVSIAWIILSTFKERNNDYSVYLCVSTSVLSLNISGLFGGCIYKKYIKRKKERE